MIDAVSIKDVEVIARFLLRHEGNLEVMRAMNNVVKCLVVKP